MSTTIFAPTLLVLATLSALAAAQNPPPATPRNPAPFEIYIDGQCRVFSAPQPTPAHPNPQGSFHADDRVCHFESPLTSNHWEYRPNSNGILKGTYFTVVEHEYVLTNPTQQQVTFVIGQYLPKGWAIDYDPQPVEIANSLAMFRVIAEPGQTVRIHVGAKD